MEKTLGQKVKENLVPIIALIAITIITALLLHNQGRLWISKSGKMYLWISDVWSAENSQHFTDPYSFSHMQHGLLFFGLMWFFREKLSLMWRLVAATTIEAAWELLENSKMIIDRYREATAALGYEGDSIYNSIGDLFSCGVGFVIAYYLGLKKTIVLFLIVEIAMILIIKDSLILNVIMLVSPIEAIKEWQSS